MTISDINFNTTRIEALLNSIVLGTGTGFFYIENSNEYLITNRHVVIDEKKSYHPTSLRIRLHTNRENLQINNLIVVDLYDDNDRHSWLEHPAYSTLQCDVVAIPMRPPLLTGDNFSLFERSSVTCFTKDLTEIPDVNPFGDVVVLGYPLGFSDDVNNLPVYRHAMIASQFGVDFRGRPYFLVDANLHPGTSGSPVVSSYHTLFKEAGSEEGYKLFGIHSAEHIVGKEPLGLNVVWYSKLIPEIVVGDSIK